MLREALWTSWTPSERIEGEERITRYVKKKPSQAILEDVLRKHARAPVSRVSKNDKSSTQHAEVPAIDSAGDDNNNNNATELFNYYLSNQPGSPPSLVHVGKPVSKPLTKF